ncbi:MAG: Asp23/Gls24 family envelope stress response protein [Thermoflexales bacterium]|nr:Asp23/Gls24 family envelope stress response protein [Thermoflexales bacterium]MDW8351707.1 Asp23/Gls24 family envelope stress response protein [Anaerolineae bacterium]
MQTSTQATAPDGAQRTEETPTGGQIVISPRVVFTLARNAALSTYGVVGIASRFTGFDCTHTDPRRGLEIQITDNPTTGAKHVTVTVHIIAEYGVRIQAVTSSLQQQIRYSIEHSTGYVVDAVNVHVTGLRVTNED